MTVYLVGAGPGSADLLTLRAAKLLATADVVVHDRLIGNGVMEKVAPWAELIDVGKNPDGKRTSQEEINRLLLDRGNRHETVVRLKGGDPFVFGRGGEEVAALTAAGLTVEVVPGITSAVAGPSAVGIPVTQRGVSSAFTVVTAHEDPAKVGALDWDALAALGSTLVVLMGARKARAIRDRLLAGGLNPATPVAVIVEATTARQRHLHLPLADLGANPVPNPAVIVIGAVAAPDIFANATLASEVPA